ncbi:hypothetical protein VTC63_002715 [Lacticaseibacillus rhamnosus]
MAAIGNTLPAKFKAINPAAKSPKSLGCLSAKSPKDFSNGLRTFSPDVSAAHDILAIADPVVEIVVKNVLI